MEDRDEDYVAVTQNTGRWAWRIVRNGCGRTGTQTFATRDEAVRAAWVVARSQGLPFVCR